MMSLMRVRAAIAPLHREARVSSEQVSQYLHGHALVPLTRDGSWLRVRGPDGYDGWVHEGYLIESTPGAEGALRLSLGCTVRLPDGGALPLPFGARVPFDAAILAGSAITDDERARRYPSEPGAIAASALRWFAGAPYLWGGVSPWGADCSGFTQAIFALHGVSLPRDAWQQAALGEPAGAGVRELLPAALLFFSDSEGGRINHVAMALGGERFVHCALGRGGHWVEDLRNPDGYQRELLDRFRFARRVLRTR